MHDSEEEKKLALILSGVLLHVTSHCALAIFMIFSLYFSLFSKMTPYESLCIYIYLELVTFLMYKFVFHQIWKYFSHDFFE